MSIKKLATTIVFSAAIGGFGLTAIALADEATIIGRGAPGGSDSAVRVCFNHDVDIKSGEGLAVIRHTAKTLPKTAAILESDRVGVVKIPGVNDDHCASAVILSGCAQWLDRVSLKPVHDHG